MFFHNLYQHCDDMKSGKLPRAKIKGAYSEVFGKWIFFKLTDMITFKPIISSTEEKKHANLYLVWKWEEKTMLMLSVVLY